MNKALSKFINDEISKEDYDTFKSSIDFKLKELTEKEQECKTLIAEKFNISLLNELDGLKEKIIDLKELTPKVLNRFVERIEIKADGTPRIFYRFSKLSIYFSDLTSNTQHSTCLVVVEMM